MPLQSTSEDNDLPVTDFDWDRIFVGREEQLDQFSFYLDRWLRLAATTTSSRLSAVPSPNDKIQGMVVLLHGRGGFGKTTLLKRYHQIALDYKQELTASKIIDLEFATQERRTLFNPAPGEEIEAPAYFNFLRNQLANALNKETDEFKEFQAAAKAVEDARKQAAGVLDNLQRDSRYAWLGGLAGEVVLALVRLKAPASNIVLSNKEMAQKAKELVGAGVEVGAEQVEKLWIKLHDKLGTKLENYLEPVLKLGLSFGHDLASFAEERPLLIFFDTYEEVDEADKFLRLVMGAAGVRTGWVLSGRDNLWAGLTQRRRSLETEYGYKDIVMSDRRFAVDFSADGVGNFSLGDIEEYFAQLCAMCSQPPLPVVSEKDAAHILTVTQGVPLAVKIAAGLYIEKPNLKTITEDVDSRREIVDQMVRRYLLHTRTNQADRSLLYGLALLRRSDQPATIAVALNLSAESSYEAELSRLHRRYGFIFTKNEQPSLHQEVRHFLRLWLLEHRTEPDIVAINQRLKDAHQKALRDLEEHRQYISLRERMKDDQWIEIYLDLCEQQFWLDPINGIELVLPFMMAASIYRRDINREATKLGRFFESSITQPYRRHWESAAQSLVYNTSRNPLPQELTGLEELVKLAGQICPNFPSPIPDYRGELEAALWWRLGEAYRGRNEERAVEWYEKALERLDQVSELEADADAIWDGGDKNDLENKDAESESILTRAFEAKPGSVSAYLDEAKVSASKDIAYKDFKRYQRNIQDLNHKLQLKPKSAQAYAERGVAFGKLKEYQHAIEDFDRALNLKPKLARVYCNRGNAYSNLKEYQRAIEDYDRAIKLDPKLAGFYYNRGIAYSFLKEYQRAIQDFDRAIRLNPNDAWTYNQRGQAYFELEEYQRAIQDYTRAIELDPKYARVYASRGSAYYNLKEYQRAIQDYTRAIELDPKYVWAYNERGRAYFEIEDYQRAIQDYTRAIKLDPSYAWAYGNRALAYCKLEEYERAIQDYDRVIELDPNDAWAYNERGRAYYELEEYERAIQDYNRAIELDPNDARAYGNRALAYDNLNEYQRTIQDYDRAIELDPSYAWAYGNRALAYANLKEYQRAIQDYTRAIELDPNDDWAYKNRGSAFENLGEYQKAIQDYDRAIELDPTNAWTYKKRGDSYRDLKEYERAIQDYDKCIELKPDAAWTYFNRGLTYLLLKDVKRAASDYAYSWELNSTVVAYGWMTEWSKMCQEEANLVVAARLESIAAINSQSYVACVCRAVALWIREHFQGALIELDLAISLDSDEWDAYFWKGMVCASLGQAEEALTASEKSLAIGLPPVLLSPLRWLKQEKPEFYEKYALPLLTRYELMCC